MLISDRRPLRRPSPEIVEYVNLEDMDTVRNIICVKTFVSQNVTFSYSLK
jgi:hypothetical protein